MSTNSTIYYTRIQSLNVEFYPYSKAKSMYGQLDGLFQLS